MILFPCHRLEGRPLCATGSWARWRRRPSSTTILPRRRAVRQSGLLISPPRRSQWCVRRQAGQRAGRGGDPRRRPHSGAARRRHPQPGDHRDLARQGHRPRHPRHGRGARSRRSCARPAARFRAGLPSASTPGAARSPSRAGPRRASSPRSSWRSRFEGAGVAAIIYTDIDRDGVLAGLNLQSTAELARSTSIPVIASGGFAGLDDIKALLRPEHGMIAGAIAGRALYDGRLDARAALDLIAQAGARSRP